ncbi:hypothetical protein EZV62_003084 [Acer yangbiense]|uniref:Uncharacterized protein n=1 Tax=Acer yangbiense TaxID=1000413 RepID=A0A5C7IGK7_9ROSI|nr:hypothetical protein EZV62_003084 [Acer yangbiense]
MVGFRNGGGDGGGVCLVGGVFGFGFGVGRWRVGFSDDSVVWFNLSSLTSQRRKAEPEHKMIKYMKPLKMFQETLKRTIEMPESVFIGFNVTDKNVSLAISDQCYLGEYGYGVFPRDQTLLDNLVSKVQKSIEKFDLEGIIVAGKYHDSPPVNIHNLIHDLCKKGKFQSLKYACYTDNVTSPCRRLDQTAVQVAGVSLARSGSGSTLLDHGQWLEEVRVGHASPCALGSRDLLRLEAPNASYNYGYLYKSQYVIVIVLTESKISVTYGVAFLTFLLLYICYRQVVFGGLGQLRLGYNGIPRSGVARRLCVTGGQKTGCEWGVDLWRKPRVRSKSLRVSRASFKRSLCEAQPVRRISMWNWKRYRMTQALEPGERARVEHRTLAASLECGYG